MDEIRTVELAGPPAKMGEAFGEQFRDEIRAFTEIRTDRLARFVREFDPTRTVSREQILEATRLVVTPHSTYDPHIWDEFCGIARAAELTLEELLICNGLTDLRDFVLCRDTDAGRPTDEHLGECSAFLVPAERAAGRPIVGQTWDMHPDALDYIVMVRRRPPDAPETLALTTVGCLCLIGMNSEGVSVGNTNLIPIDARPGVNYLFTITRALKCASAEEAAEAIEITPRLSGHNYVVADARTAVNVEASATRTRRTVVEQDVFCHTNHYLDPELRRIELPAQDLRNSQWRQERLTANFRSLSGAIDMDDCWAQLSDATRGHGAVCNEDREGVYAPFSTVATVVQQPGAGTLYVCAGGARLGRKQVLGL